MIELNNIYKLYEMGGETVTALDDITLTIQDGEFTSIMGPSGSEIGRASCRERV